MLGAFYEIILNRKIGMQMHYAPLNAKKLRPAITVWYTPFERTILLFR
jgi:hypothetical protein